MPSRTRSKTLVLILVLASSLAGARAGAIVAADADSLHRRALLRLADGTADSRRMALQDLEAATHLAPERTDLLHDLARAATAVGQHDRARTCLERIARLTPDDAGALEALGLSWKWEWLASTEPSSCASALEVLMRAARQGPRHLEPRLALTAIALARGNVELGMRAARSAIACDRGSPEALLALGCAAYRTGALALADSAFRIALPRLDAESRRHFTDLSRIAGREAAAPDTTGAPSSPNASFWRGHDPDLTTPENETELNFDARVAHALLLFRDRDGVRWDMRAEMLARYGIPSAIDLHPPDREPEYVYKRWAPVAYAPDELAYPYNLQVWSYPELGMRVELWDQSLSQTYVLPISSERDPDPRPDPASLAANPDLIPLGNGRGVYRALPPGTTPMPARGLISSFPSDAGARLTAHLEAPGGPADSLTAAWVVVSPDGHEVARGSGNLSVSACDPTERRVADFDAEVPPGDYRVDLSVTDGHGRRGVVHLEARVVSTADRPSMSDLVLLCGAAAVRSNTQAVRIEPSFDRRLPDTRTVAVYFEVDRLTLGPDGQARFAYTYAVRPSGSTGRRAEPAFEATREEENVGGHRRQFVTASLPALRRGSYDFEVEVRDLVSGATVRRSITFIKE